MLTERELEEVTVVFKSFETGMREATIHPKVYPPMLGCDKKTKLCMNCECFPGHSLTNWSIALDVMVSVSHSTGRVSCVTKSLNHSQCHFPCPCCPRPCTCLLIGHAMSHQSDKLSTRPSALGMSESDPIWGPLIHIFVDEKKKCEG